MNELGAEFVTLLLGSRGINVPCIDSIQVERQYKRIDVLIVVNGTIAICIEDKVGTVEHSGQLARYLEELTAKRFTRDQVVPVYIQTGDQSNYEAIEEAGYALLRRRDLLDLFARCDVHHDSIARDLCASLSAIEHRVQAFRTLPLDQWHPHAWRGFFMELQAGLADGNWGYVSNASGGFMGYWWRWLTVGPTRVYLQLEEGNLVCKVLVEDRPSQASERDNWSAAVQRSAYEAGLVMQRPRRVGRGRTMTVADAGPYRAANADGSLDFAATLERLRSYDTMLGALVHGYPPKVNPQ